MGGMRAVEWAVTHPERVERLMVLASTAAATADQIAWCHAQLRAITADPHWAGGDFPRTGGDPGPVAGLAVARRIAHITYRSADELALRFGRAARWGSGARRRPVRGRELPRPPREQADRPVRRRAPT